MNEPYISYSIKAIVHKRSEIYIRYIIACYLQLLILCKAKLVMNTLKKWTDVVT